MINKSLILFFILCSTILFSQEDAWVYFNDKPSAQVYLDNPLVMLSQRALDRRTNQNISLMASDIPVEKLYMQQIKNSPGITVLAKSKWLNALHIRGTVIEINALKNLAFVQKIEFADKKLNTITSKKTELRNAVAKGKKNQTLHVNDLDYGLATNQVEMLNTHLLHKQNYTGKGKIIAVLDAGFPGVNTALPFKRIQENNQILGGYNFVSRDVNFYTGNSHGTEVLSTIAAYKEGSLVGTAPDASFYLFITEDVSQEGPLEESLWVEAAERADSLGVDIITTSLGYFGDYTNPRYNHVYSDMDGKTTFISRGADLAFSKGILIVASAGNEGNASEKHIGAPADVANVLTIGAVNASEVKATFSSIGPSFNGIIKPDVMAQGQAVYVSDASGNITTTNGTSFSCPIMAGSIACLWQAFPNKTNQEIRNLVLNSCDKFTSPNNDYGYGIPDFAIAGNAVLSISDYENPNYTIYPVPTSNEILFSVPEKGTNFNVKIYSVVGQKLMEFKITSEINSVSLQSLDKGVYFYTLEGDDFKKSGKIIKN